MYFTNFYYYRIVTYSGFLTIMFTKNNHLRGYGVTREIKYGY